MKNLPHSLKARLFNLSDHDNRRYQQLLVRFLHERFLFRLSKSRYKDNFVLKGGALLYAYDTFLKRPTLDIDFLGCNINNDKNSIMQTFSEIVSLSGIDDGVEYLSESIKSTDITQDHEYPGVRISLIGVLDTIRKELIFDIGFGDVIIPRPVIMEYPTIIEEFEKPIITAYSMETVVAEKFHTLVERSVFNSRMKDFFDLYRIIKEFKFDYDTLLNAIRATFENRNSDLSSSKDVFSREYVNNPVFKQRWDAYCNKTDLKNIPDFSEIMNEIINFFKPFYEKQ